ncbi:hypothetical protein ZWY2020_017335 [Hordeum vulgare]|nr:hypothetical protein ZWY2020_017335 [Hordeum vulgare]
MQSKQAGLWWICTTRDEGENKKADGGLGVRDKIVPPASHISGLCGGMHGDGGGALACAVCAGRCRLRPRQKADEGRSTRAGPEQTARHPRKTPSCKASA